MRCHAALALVAVLGLWAAPVLAASLSVVDEGDGVYVYELVLEPGEVVAGIQLDLILDGAPVVVEETGWAVPFAGPPLSFVVNINPWNLTSTVAEVPDGNIRLAHTYEQGGNPEAGLAADFQVLPDGNLIYHSDLPYQSFFCDIICPEFEPTGIPVARLLVEQGLAPTRYTAGVCVPAAGATCSFPETSVPEPVALVLLAPLALVLVILRNTAK